MADHSEEGFTFAVPKPLKPITQGAKQVRVCMRPSCEVPKMMPDFCKPAAGPSVQQNLVLQNPLTSRATVVDMSNRQNGASTPKPQAVPIPEPRLKPDQRPGKIPLEKGYSQMDWMRLTRTHPDLAGLGGQSNMRQIPLSEVKKHRSKNDTWLVLRGKVYNVTPYLKFHPGGLEWIMKGAGLDATLLFNKYHAWVNADFMLEKCLVGYLAADASKPPVQQ